MSFVYLETGIASNNFNLRGEVGKNDDPVTFAECMLRKGLRVALSDDNFGKNISNVVLGLKEYQLLNVEKTAVTGVAPKFNKKK